MNSALAVMKDLLMKKGITNEPDQADSKAGKSGSVLRQIPQKQLFVLEKENDNDDNDQFVDVDPEIMFKKRDSSSSEDGRIDNSDELMEIDCNKFIAECAAEASHRKRAYPQVQYRRPDPQETADDVIRRAEAGKIRMLPTPGNYQNPIQGEFGRFNGGTANQHSSVVDENYIVVGSHIDPSLRDKIKRGEYVDFSRLLPKEKSHTDESRLELIHKGGQAFFVPADRDGNNISSFYKWEQAFRVYSNVYLKEFLDCTTELIQYNHIICSASSSFTWKNVYQYDKEFRSHLGMFPECSSAIILQQAWSICLKDRVGTSFGSGGQKSGNFNRGTKEVCQHFNKGLCTAGRNCKYDHKCLECGKFGHGAHICRRRNSQGSVAPQSHTQNIANSSGFQSGSSVANMK